ncbi:MAG: deoxyuridine 5-triphosphate nucleotidohydrolase [Bacteroidota bacterium]|jgi:dUTP pyrophosphatase
MKVNIVQRGALPLPAYETPGSAGMDLRASLEAPILLQPMERRLVPTGLSIELPVGYEAQVRPRSGLALRKGLTVANAPGTIDSDYRGEIQVIVVNLSAEAQSVQPGERIAQLVVARYEQVDWIPVQELNPSRRGSGGFGSTGT